MSEQTPCPMCGRRLTPAGVHWLAAMLDTLALSEQQEAAR